MEEDDFEITVDIQLTDEDLETLLKLKKEYNRLKELGIELERAKKLKGQAFKIMKDGGWTEEDCILFFQMLDTELSYREQISTARLQDLKAELAGTIRECTPTDCTMCEAYPDPFFSRFPPDCNPRKRGVVRCVIQGEEVID